MSNSFENIHYDAFISYRHRPIDEFVAQNLQLLLETYTVPQSAKDMVQKERISRIFRDQDELPLSDNLGNSIELALEHSEYFIAICSPAYRESKWCMKEIETFISKHGYGKIIVVICEGNTNDSFPPQLLSAETEPFASDVRGKNNKEIMSKLKIEYVRVAASLLGVPYDTLRQREQERILERKAKALKRLSIIASSVAVLSIAAVTTIGVQKWQLSNNQIDTLIAKAENEYSVGNTKASLEDTFEAYSLSKRNFGRNKGKIQGMLTRALGLYDVEAEYVSKDTVEMGSEIVNVQFSNNGEHILIADKTGNVKVVKADDFGQVEFTTSAAAVGVDSASSAGFVDDDHVYYLTPKGQLKITDFVLGEEPKISALLLSRKNHCTYSSPDHKYIAVVVDTEVDVAATEAYAVTGQMVNFVYTDKLNEEKYNELAFNGYATFLDDKTFLYSLNDNKTDTSREKECTKSETVTVLNLKNNDTKTYNTGVSALTYATLSGNRLYLCYREISPAGEDTMKLRCIDYDTDTVCWEKDIDNTGVDAIYTADNGYIIMASGSVIMELEPANGELIDVYNMSEAKLISFENCKSGSVKLLTSLGEEIIMSVSSEGLRVSEHSELMKSVSLKYVVKPEESNVLYAIPTLNPMIFNKYEPISEKASEPYAGTTVDLLYSDKASEISSYGNVVAAYGTPYGALYLPDRNYNIYTFEDGTLITVNKAETYIIDEVKLDEPVEVIAGNDTFGNAYYACQSDENIPGSGVGIGKDGTVISTFDNFAGISEDGTKIILNTLMVSSGERELRAYPIYSYKELVNMAKQGARK